MKTNNASKHGHVFDTSEIEPRCIKCSLRIRIDDSALHDAFERSANDRIESAERELRSP